MRPPALEGRTGATTGLRIAFVVIVACILVVGAIGVVNRVMSAEPPMVASSATSPMASIVASPMATNMAAAPEPTMTAQSAPLVAIDDSALERKKAASEREARLEREIDNVNVNIYTTSWCPACKQAKEWMSSHGIAYTDHDIERDKAAEKTWKRLTSTKKIPLFDIEGDTRVGFDPNWVMASRRRVAEGRL